jgi:VWFA-related protein
MEHAMRKLVVGVLICASAASPLAAETQQAQETQEQAPAQQGPTFRTGVDLIAVDVAVVDQKGQPVENLLPPDFVVKIDGQPRRVVSAEHVKIDVEAAKREAADPFESLYTTNLRPINGRQIILAIDQLGVRFGSARPILASAGKFLDRLSPADRVAFVAFPEPGIQVGFTNDHTRIRRAMDRVVGRQSPFPGRFNIGMYEAIAIAEKADSRAYEEVVNRECPKVTGFTREQCERDVVNETGNMVRNLRQSTTDSLRGLEDLLRALTVIEGPKTLILMSEGLTLDTPTALDGVIRAAAFARVTINVLLMDVPRDDITVGQLGPTLTEDRDMQVSGLADLAAASRGSLYNIIGTGETIFERLAGDMLAYYMLGVEEAAGDRDGRAHRVDVEVQRRGVTVRSRRAFVLSPATTTRRNAEETLLDALKSPFGVAEIPVRVTTFTQKDPASDKARIVVAADVGQPGGEPAEYTVGYVVLDSEGMVVSGTAEKRTLSVPGGASSVPRDYLGEVIVEPGNYSLRFGVVDSEGRRGGVIRELNAWKLGGEEFAMGDLLVGDAGDGTSPRIRPGVEPRVLGNLGAFMEMYSTVATGLDKTTVNFEIADDQDSPALISAPSTLLAGTEQGQRVAQGTLSAMLLPPGRYVARARILRDGNMAGVLVRPFILDPPADANVASPFMRGSVAKFDSRLALSGRVITAMLDLVEKRSPDMKGPLAEARAGRYGTAAVEALTTGDQEVAAFLKGLDWFSKGQLTQAVTQLEVAAGPRREFFPAAFFLGAAFAAAGRDRDAAGVWQMASGTESRPTFFYTWLADARLRDGQPGSVIDVLRPAYQRTPTDDELGHRLMAAYLMTGRFEEALPVLDGYLSRNPTDQVALLAAVFAQYQVATKERLALPAAELAKLGRYVRAYEGPYKNLLAKYVEILRRP